MLQNVLFAKYWFTVSVNQVIDIKWDCWWSTKSSRYTPFKIIKIPFFHAKEQVFHYDKILSRSVVFCHSENTINRGQ